MDRECGDLASQSRANDSLAGPMLEEYGAVSPGRLLDWLPRRLSEPHPSIFLLATETRRYPGLGTQNTADTCRTFPLFLIAPSLIVRATDHLSEMPMPKDYPPWPSGAQVQAYLQTFVEKFDLLKHITLSTEVISAVQDHTTLRWTVETRPTNPDRSPREDVQTSKREFDVLMVCNGTFSDGAIPNYPGMEEYKKAGGNICHTSDFLNLEDARGKHVVVVGYGKSACDTAVALSRVAASTVSVNLADCFA